MARNRISHTIDPKDLADFKECTAKMLVIARRIVAGTSLEDNTGQPMGDIKGWDYVKRCHAVAKAKGAEMFTALEFNMSLFDQDITLADSVFEFRGEVSQVDELILLAWQLVGRDLMDHANKVRARLEELAEDHADYKALFEEVNFFYENRGKKPSDSNKAASPPK